MKRQGRQIEAAPVNVIGKYLQYSNYIIFPQSKNGKAHHHLVKQLL